MSCVLQGQYKSTVMCQRCGRKSVVFEPFVCLPLEIPSPTRCSLAVSVTDRHTHTHYMYLVVQCCSLCCVSIHSKLWAQWLTETGCTHTHTHRRFTGLYCTSYSLVQHSTVKAFIMRAWSATGLNLRRGQSLVGKMARCGSKRRHGKNNMS